MTKPTIAFLGTGLMGSRMARHLLAAGYALTAWNRTIAKAEPLDDDGARIAVSCRFRTRQFHSQADYRGRRILR